MIRRTVAAAVAAALLIPLGPSAIAAPDPAPELVAETATRAASLDKDGPVLSLGDGPGRELYLVRLESPAVPTRELARSADQRGPQAQRTPSAADYQSELQAEQAELRRSIRRITGSAPQVRHTYTQAMNGMAVRLTRKQAAEVAQLDGVAAVQVDEERELQTDHGPEWIGAPSLWDGSQAPGGEGTQGEGVIVGIIDSGLNPANPSFHDVVPTEDGGDGYDHTNPWGSGNYTGVCDPASDVHVEDWGCNDKLIGYWNFTGDGTVYDDDGHGSHTGSTSAGNQVDATTYSARGTEFEFSTTENIKGVAPHANIIGYDVCAGGCSLAAITAAIDQAIADGVDVINYSIGSSGASNPWDDADAIGFLNARAAGIHVATSAGNAGPGFATLGSPADVPWITSVGATQHDRQWQGRLEDITADGDATHPDLEGVTFSAATDGTHPLVDAEDLGNPLCLAGEFGGADVSDAIVVCMRGETGRVEKGEVVRSEGAAGMVLVNDAASGDSLNADPHALPAVHVTHEDGMALREWMATVEGEQASLSGGIRHVGEDVADIMAAFSSRGPNRAVPMISPSVSAPGVDILAAYGSENAVEWGFVSGTSMASPHVAGSLALLDALQPEWSPAAAQSALMTTAERDIRDDDETQADWLDMGSGRVELRRAARAGLVLEEDLAGYVAANPAEGGDVRELNTASMADDQCLQTCEWTRTLTGTATGEGSWSVSVENLSDGLTLSTGESSVDLTDGGTADLTVTADVMGAPTDEWLFGAVVLTPPEGSDAPTAHLPVAVLPSSGVLPDSIDITTRRDAGSWPTDGIRSIGFDELDIEARGLVPEDRQELSVPQDTTNDNPYDGNGAEVVQIEVPEGASRLLIRLDNGTAPDFDLYVGRGEVGPANEACFSATGGSAELCDIANPEPGTWWALVQNWQATSADQPDTVDLVTAVVVGDQGNLRAEGPEGPVGDGEDYSIRTFFDEEAMEPGQTWHGALSLGSSGDSAGDIGIVPVTVQRIADDVTKTADVSTAGPGDTITYTVQVAPNVTPEDLTYTVTDTLPAGTTYVEGSATDGATVTDGVVSWTGELPTSFGEEGSYTFTTSADDQACVNPLTGDASYFDLATEVGLTPQPGLEGDTSLWTAFSSLSFGHLGQQQAGLSFSDDGFLIFDPGSNYGGQPWEPQAVPDPAQPNNVEAMLWQDMAIHYDAAANHGVTLASGTDGSFVVMEFDGLRRYDDPEGAQGTYDVQVFSEVGSNDRVFSYDNITGPLDRVTIGAENAAGSAGSALVNNGDASSVITDGTVVCANYESAQGDPLEFSYQVTVDDTVHNRQVLRNSLEHTTSDPGAEPETTSAVVTVEGAPERSGTSLAIDPNRVKAGGETEASATVFSAGEQVPTGDVEFLIDDEVVGTATLNDRGRAKATLTAPEEAGTYSVVARYLGDEGNRPSTSDPVNLVAKAPGTPNKRVKPRIMIKTPKKVKVGQAKRRVKIAVSAPRVVPSGKVRVIIRGAGKKKSVLKNLNKAGRTKVKLPRYRKTGKVRVRVRYLGDAAVKRGQKQVRFKVRPRRR